MPKKVQEKTSKVIEWIEAAESMSPLRGVLRSSCRGGGLGLLCSPQLESHTEAFGFLAPI